VYRVGELHHLLRGSGLVAVHVQHDRDAGRRKVVPVCGGAEGVGAAADRGPGMTVGKVVLFDAVVDAVVAAGLGAVGLPDELTTGVASGADPTCGPSLPPHAAIRATRAVTIARGLSRCSVCAVNVVGVRFTIIGLLRPVPCGSRPAPCQRALSGWSQCGRCNRRVSPADDDLLQSGIEGRWSVRYASGCIDTRVRWPLGRWILVAGMWSSLNRNAGIQSPSSSRAWTARRR
jgi:hypothetical protein